MLTMKVLGLTLDEASHAPILILQEETGQELLPIWIGAMEAVAISLALGKVPMERPLTHDLLFLLLQTLDARLSGVELVDLRGGTYYTDLVLLLKNGETRRLDCRPSDAVALALRAEAPIRTSRDVLLRAGVQRASDDGRRACVNAFAQNPPEANIREGMIAEEAMGADQQRLFDMLRSLDPESKRKM